MPKILTAGEQSVLPEIPMDASDVKEKNLLFFCNYLMFLMTRCKEQALLSDAVLKVSLQEFFMLLRLADEHMFLRNLSDNKNTHLYTTC